MDTIVALATGPLPSAIAVIRVSGPKTLALIDAHTTKRHESWRPVLDNYNDNGRVLDQVISTLFLGPNSFTGEDVWEISTHGGRSIVQSILESLTTHEGVRLASPGEFTRRAVEHGKMDLLQAEAIADLIAADSPKQHDLAIGHLNGRFSDTCALWQREILTVLGGLEAMIDFPDESDVSVRLDTIAAKLAALISGLEDALKNASVGTRIRDGLTIALIGPPNAGKSSLLNALLARDRAIVTDIAGTTRDYIQERMQLAGQAVTVVDTAGLRDTGDEIEKIGIDKSLDIARNADIRVFVRDVTDNAHTDWVDRGESDVFVDNKIDLLGPDRASQLDVSRETLGVSATLGHGINDLKQLLAQRVEQLTSATEQPLVTRARHVACIEQSVQYLANAVTLIGDDGLTEFIAEEVRSAHLSLEQLIGRIDSEDVLGQIFGEFCIGK